MNRLDYYGLALNLAKSTIAVSESRMLGHKITKDEIFVLPERISAIIELPEPSTIKELCHALGLIFNDVSSNKPLKNYLQGKVKNDYKIRLTRKAFQDIKHALRVPLA